MRGKITTTALALALLSGCGATEGDLSAAREDATERGFTILNIDGNGSGRQVWVEVSFGETGCVGTIEYQSGSDPAPVLNTMVAVPGTTDETVAVQVSDPRAGKLLTIPPFKNVC